MPVYRLAENGLNRRRASGRLLAVLALAANFPDALAADTPSREFDLAPTDELVIALPCQLWLEQASRAHLSVQAPPDVLAAIRLSQQGRRATLEPVRSIRSRQRIVVRASVPALATLVVGSAVEARVGLWRANRLVLRLGGASELQLDDLRVAELVADLGGASSLRGSGEAGRQVYRIDGAGHVDTRALRGNSVHIAIKGSGDAVVNAQRELRADIDGVAEVRYAGQPNVTQQINGVGSVEPI